jgi:ATP-dependent RNA helicase DHR2
MSRREHTETSRGKKRLADGTLKNSKRIINFAPGDDQQHNESSNAASRVAPASLKERARQLQQVRQRLPISHHVGELKVLRTQPVLLLAGETGSGKSTQVPQFLIDEPWCKKSRRADAPTVGGCIAITQPRRMAAISLARRVAEEMGTPLGNSSPASQVGYSVRFENSTSPSTRIKFLTDGMLLQEMLRDPWLTEYSAVVVDEVHERGVNVDLVLGFLRRLQSLQNKDDGRRGIPIRIVVMSATADMQLLQSFFENGGASSIHDNDSTKHAKSTDMPDDEWLGFSDADEDTLGEDTKATVQSLFVKGRQYPVTIDYAPTPVPDLLDAAFQRVVDIHSHRPLPGDVLVFVTGQEAVESLVGLLSTWSRSIENDPKTAKTIPKTMLLPLYAALPSNAQQRVFQQTPKFTRKIIIATNIAETSITVPGIKYVVDTGKAKQRQFRPSLNLDTLLTVPISRSSAKQRSGRAGRDGPGTAYRLYTEADFLQLTADTEPEIERCDLSQLVLTLKAHKIDDLNSFPFLTVPRQRALTRALAHLLQLSALEPSTGHITDLGREMSLLPLPANLARVLLASAEPTYDCVAEIIDIVSALSVENIFLNIQYKTSTTPHDSDTLQPIKKLTSSTTPTTNSDVEVDESAESRAHQARRQLFRREGDHLTLLATMQAYAAENTDRRRWCEERYISHRAMSGAMDIRKQLQGMMEQYTARQSDKASGKRQNGRAPGNGSLQSDRITKSNDQDPLTLPTRILKCLLTGFHTNIARLTSDGSYQTIISKQAVAIHPASVLFKVDSDGRQAKKYEAIMYNEFVYTGTKAYARNVSAIEMGWLIK